MEIKFKIDGATNDKLDMIITNEGLNNDNFVSVYIEDDEYMVSVNDLYSAILVFKKIQNENKEQ